MSAERAGSTTAPGIRQRVSLAQIRPNVGVEKIKE